MDREAREEPGLAPDSRPEFGARHGHARKERENLIKVIQVPHAVVVQGLEKARHLREHTRERILVSPKRTHKGT